MLVSLLDSGLFLKRIVAVFWLYALIEGSFELDVVAHQPHQQRWTV